MPLFRPQLDLAREPVNGLTVGANRCMGYPFECSAPKILCESLQRICGRVVIAWRHYSSAGSSAPF